MVRGAVRTAVALGAVGAALLGYVAGRVTRAEDACARCGSASAAEPHFEPLDPTAPPWAVTGRLELPSVGSIFRNRLTSAVSPLEGFEAVVVSPRATECTESCPLSLRVIGGEQGTLYLEKIVTSLGPNLRALTRARGLSPESARWIETGAASLAARKDPARMDPPDGNPLRALFIAMPRPDVGSRAHSVGLALGDLPDPHFDAVDGEAGEHPGWLLFASRLEQRTGPEDERLWGAVAFVHVASRASWRPIPDSSPELGLAFGALWGHFAALPREIQGVYLDPSGGLHLFGSDLVLHDVTDEDLRLALSALLRRV